MPASATWVASPHRLPRTQRLGSSRRWAPQAAIPLHSRRTRARRPRAGGGGGTGPRGSPSSKACRPRPWLTPSIHHRPPRGPRCPLPSRARPPSPGPTSVGRVPLLRQALPSAPSSSLRRAGHSPIRATRGRTRPRRGRSAPASRASRRRAGPLRATTGLRQTPGAAGRAQRGLSTRARRARAPRPRSTRTSSGQTQATSASSRASLR
mmetsp:Transcript_133869/g.373271  ORF Transcript_133869/g.373271 Transcript_133869/m.373271 type:complete len:208 (-) Transcript_133869:538-1161(-)